MIYKKQYGQPFDTEGVVGSFLPMMETIPYLTKEPDGFSYAMEPQDILYTPVLPASGCTGMAASGLATTILGGATFCLRCT